MIFCPARSVDSGCERKAMIDRRTSCRSCASANCSICAARACTTEPRPISAADLVLMRRIDELHLEHPFAGSADAARHAQAREGFEVGRKHVRR